MPARSDALEKDILTLVLQDMNRGEQRVSGDIYLDGLTNVLSEPEFLESDDARRAVRLFEERSLLQDLLARTMSNSNIGGVQVLIGGEGKWEELKQCSVVLPVQTSLRRMAAALRRSWATGSARVRICWLTSPPVRTSTISTWRPWVEINSRCL